MRQIKKKIYIYLGLHGHIRSAYISKCLDILVEFFPDGNGINKYRWIVCTCMYECMYVCMYVCILEAVSE